MGYDHQSERGGVSDKISGAEDVRRRASRATGSESSRFTGLRPTGGEHLPSKPTEVGGCETTLRVSSVQTLALQIPADLSILYQLRLKCEE